MFQMVTLKYPSKEQNLVSRIFVTLDQKQDWTCRSILGSWLRSMFYKKQIQETLVYFPGKIRNKK